MDGASCARRRGKPVTLLAAIVLLLASCQVKCMEPQESPSSSQQHHPQPHCTLGEDVFQIGERWNPYLDPFGVQVCVLCECTIRQRKACYEAKTICRRITNECPIIKSCPDGKEPVTIAGQCCKSCQTTNSPATPDGQVRGSSHESSAGVAGATNRSSLIATKSLQDTFAPLATVAYNEQPQQVIDSSTQTSILAFRILFVNERTKEYLSMVKSLPPCASRESDKHTSPAPVKAPKKNANKNDINGIDSRLAFKSLKDAHTTTYSSTRLAAGYESHASGSSSGGSSSSGSNNNQNQNKLSALAPNSSGGGSAAAATAADLHDHQHPNDVQTNGAGGASRDSSSSTRIEFRGNHWRDSGSGSQTNDNYNQQQHQHQQTNSVPIPRPNSCILGNDTFQIGDTWHPNLNPPSGPEECVICNCLVKLKRSPTCYDTRVTCKRIEDECPKNLVCPRGGKPVKIEGQCCPTCISASTTPPPNGVGSNSDQQHANSLAANGASGNRMNNLLAIHRNETVLRNFRNILQMNISSCMERDAATKNGDNEHGNSNHARNRDSRQTSASKSKRKKRLSGPSSQAPATASFSSPR